MTAEFLKKVNRKNTLFRNTSYSLFYYSLRDINDQKVVLHSRQPFSVFTAVKLKKIKLN